MVVLVGLMFTLLYKACPNVKQPGTVLLGAEFNAQSQREPAIRQGLPEDLDQFAEPRDTSNLDRLEKHVADHAARVRARTMHPDDIA